MSRCFSSECTSVFSSSACLLFSSSPLCVFLNAPAPTEIYTLSLHDALPIYGIGDPSEYHGMILHLRQGEKMAQRDVLARLDRKSTRLNSSHEWISYAVFCLKKKMCFHGSYPAGLFFGAAAGLFFGLAPCLGF